MTRIKKYHSRSPYRGSHPNNTRSFSSGRHGRTLPHKAAKLDPALLIRKAEQIEQDVYQPQHTFAEFALCEALKRNVLQRGYSQPTPIQDQAIPLVLQGRDVVGIANTGTGKTAAFLLPLLHKIYTTRTERVLIVAPTRELAVQIHEECELFARGMNIFSVLCIGGASMQRQIYSLRRRPQIVIGTPGRLKDLHGQGVLQFGLFSTIVLDEVDRMLDMGFIRDVKYLISQLPPKRQSLFFSATLSPSIKEIIGSFLHNPVTISVKSQETALNIDQDVIKTQGKMKLDVLHDLLIQDGFEKVIVFGRTKWGIEKLAHQLQQRGFAVAALHGNKSQGQRQRALQEFKQNKATILLATDIASRGLDIADVTHVINYDLPETYEDYVHRIGRTGRSNKKGTALSFID